VIGAIAMPRPPRKLLLLGASLLVVDLLIVSSWFGFEKLAQRVGVTADAVIEAGEQRNNLLLGADAERTRVALATLELWRQAPLRGHGGGGFRVLFPAQRPAEVSDRLYDHAHNDYAQLLAEFGLLGALLAVGIAGGAVVCAIRAMRTRKRRSIQGLALGCVVALLALAIHSFTDFNLQIPANASLFTVILALAWICRHGFTSGPVAHAKARHQSAHHRSSKVAALALGGLASMSCAAVSDLSGVCKTALSEPVASVTVPSASVTTALAIRSQRDANPKDESLRARAGEVAVANAVRALALTARGQGAPARELEEGLRLHLHDTAWRVEQAVRAGRSDAAQTLLLMVRIGMAEPTQVAKSCAVLERTPAGDAVLWYERALCNLHTRPAVALDALQQAAQHGHVLAQESLGQLCLKAAKPDFECAVSWLCRALGSGHGGAGAQAAWVIQQHDRSGEAQSFVRILYQRGADAGDPVSANNLGEMYETGLVGRPDIDRAEHWYLRAAELGLVEAQLNLARLWLATAAGTERRAQAAEKLRALQSSRPSEVNALVQRYGLQL
jgi:TPR repeat protein